MATRVNYPSSIKSVTWYPQFQETNNSISLPAGKSFGITKRVLGIAPNTIVPTKATHMRTLYGDVNNNAVPYAATWTLTTRDTTGAYLGTAVKQWSGTLTPGQTVTLEVSGLQGVTTSTPVSNTYRAYRVNGNNTYFNIFAYPAGDGIIRFDVTNPTGGNVTLNGGEFYAYYFRSVNDIANNVYNYGVRKSTPLYAEMAENGIPYDAVEKIFKRVYELMVEREGVTSPNQTEIYQDYFGHLSGYGTDKQLLYGTESEHIATFASVSAARGSSLYYKDQGWGAAYTYRNRFVNGYFDGIRQLYGGANIYNTIANIERNYIAMEDRKVGVFGWGDFEGVSGGIESYATDQRLPLPGGDLIRTSRPTGSFSMLQSQAFWSELIGNNFTMWNDGTQYSTDITCWDYAHIGGADPIKTQWQPTGGDATIYDANNPSHPKRDPNLACGAPWSDSAAPGHNGAFAGTWLYSQIKNRTTELYYANFSYTKGGVNTTGYASGNAPVTGAKGNASVSRINNGNAGQHNIIKQWFAKKPIVMEGNGSEGRVVIIQNPFADIMETIIYNVTVNGQVQSISHKGPNLGVYNI